MIDPHARIKPYQAVIIKEAERWLLSGRPIPLFVLFDSGASFPEKFGRFAGRDIAPANSPEGVYALDYLMARSELDRRLGDNLDYLGSGPAERFATILMIAEGEVKFVRLKLPRNLNLDEETDAQKLSALNTLLDNYALAAVSDGDQRSTLATSLRPDLEEFVTRLLQRPATEVEITELLVRLDQKETDR